MAGINNKFGGNAEKPPNLTCHSYSFTVLNLI